MHRKVGRNETGESLLFTGNKIKIVNFNYVERSSSSLLFPVT